MKTSITILSLIIVGALPGLTLAQSSYLSAPDGNPARALRVDDNGRIGIGTANPRWLLDVADTAQVAQMGIGTSHPQGVSRFWVVNGSTVAGSLWNFGLRGDNQNTFSFEANTERGWIQHLNITAQGNVGIGTSGPGNKLTIRHALGSDDYIYRQHEYQLEITSGLGVFGSRAVAMGLLDNGKGVIQVKESNVGYNDLLLNPVNGNVGIGTGSPTAKLDVAGQVNCTVLALTSDRHVKAGFEPVDNGEVLSRLARLSITAWHYTNAPGTQHIGPMAQDFHAAFGFGQDDKHITTVDADGVALASIQALYELVQAKEVGIAALEQKLADQERTFAARLAQLEQAVEQLSPSVHEIALENTPAE